MRPSPRPVPVVMLTVVALLAGAVLGVVGGPLTSGPAEPPVAAPPSPSAGGSVCVSGAGPLRTDAELLLVAAPGTPPAEDVVARGMLLAFGTDAEAVLDVGCGNGRDALFLAGLGYRVVGLDASPEAVALCEQRRELRCGCVGHEPAVATDECRDGHREAIPLAHQVHLADTARRALEMDHGMHTGAYQRVNGGAGQARHQPQGLQPGGHIGR